ncbi:AGE family epimerase/isomerase [Tianweitania sp. BSSL-BM11]|uniref:AGE family epimerase/isomerase n=1 Tax=Tianweitania aestuarii TaxID=2814886 RepID=A0ABS5RWH4_9HYPH|nr:AGE family epimerase/isomerase [Tianweitania aestuarii]MBS9721413.1 AGE family epimerase/isomerase [Tianweitania aestuarii]
MNQVLRQRSVIHRDANTWATWFWAELLPDWLRRVQDERGGVFDAIDHLGETNEHAEKTVLAQARSLFAFSHLAELSGDPRLLEAARRQAAFLVRFRKDEGLYRRALSASGEATDEAADLIARSYDQTFVILGLATLNGLSPSPATEAEIEACWQALQTRLTDPETGLLLESDAVSDPAAADAPNRAQNPHMHLYEACLQAFEVSGKPVWLSRAASVRSLALQYFGDAETGSIAEWRAPHLGPATDTSGLRREPGHQYEWAWLLQREAELGGGDPSVHTQAEQLARFAESKGLAMAGPMAGAAFEAVSARGDVLEDTFLLWPQTEAIKWYATRFLAGDQRAGEHAQSLLCLTFERWFAGHRFWANQLDADGQPIWPETLTRLFYHLALALTEGARAGLWPGIARH